jgi:hypothetical protein
MNFVTKWFDGMIAAAQIPIALRFSLVAQNG